MKLALIQLQGHDISDYRETLEEILQMTEQACQSGADLVLLPECAYPAYYIGLDETRDSLRETIRLLDALSALAKLYRSYIVIGIALEEGGELYNSAVVFDRTGALANRADKSNLWHFDRKWFAAGRPAQVFDTDFGRVGVMVCADGRIPEIARLLRLKGAGLILDCVNLVASAASPQQLTNQQYQFILQARAKENGVYIAVCDKAGVESGVITFLGRSFITAPDGSIPVQCSPDRAEIRICELDLPRPPVQAAPRRPSLYSALTRETDALPVAELVNRAYRLQDLTIYTSLVRYAYEDKTAYLAKACEYIQICEGIDAGLIILPPYEGPLDCEDLSCLSKSLHGQAIVAVGIGENGGKKAVFLQKDRMIGELYSTHLEGSPPQAQIQALKLTESIRVSALFDREIEIPEIARCAMLEGADLILWFDGSGEDAFYLKWMQTRAAENKVFVARSAACSQDDYSVLVNPDGGVICTTFQTREHTASGLVNTALSKSKDVVPGTNIVFHRIPDFYKELIV